MKKILSIAIVLVLMMAMMVPAMAVDVPSVTNDQQTVTAAVEGGAAGDYAEVSAPEISQAALDAADSVINSNAAVQEAEAAGRVTAAIAVQVEIYDAAGNNISEAGGTVILPKDAGVQDMVAIAAYAYKNGAWNAIGVQDNGATVAVTASSFCPIIVVYAEKVQSDSTEPVAPQPTGTVVSPQTGDNTALWTVLAIAMVACAGVCFVSARKESAK